MFFDDDFAAYRGTREWLTAHDPDAAGVLARAERAARRVAWSTAVRPPPLRREPAVRAVPSGHIRYDDDPTSALAHTVVSPKAYRVLTEDGVVGPELQHVVRDDAHFRPPYDWLRWRMLRTLPGYRGGYPMWMWLRIRRADLVSQVGHSARVAPGSILLTLRVPRIELLATDYQEWHSVLNGYWAMPLDCPVCGSRRCGRECCLDVWFEPWWDAQVERVPRRADGRDLPWWRWPVPMRAELFATWETVLDVAGARDVQGCVEAVRAEWVVDAVRLDAPTRSRREVTATR